VIDVQRATIACLLALGLLVGLTAASGAAAAKPPVEVENEESQRCETSYEGTFFGKERTVTVHYPCDADVDRECDYHGPFECTVTVTTPQVDDDEPVETTFCHEGHNFDPVPCVIDVGI